ncbi:MAG: sugar phosphate isomerase/epimerase family protein [Flavisolibacter sp.]
MKIAYCCPYWGSESLPVDFFFSKLKKAGYNGLEIFLPGNNNRLAEIMEELNDAKEEDQDFYFIAQLICPERKITVAEYIRQSLQELERLASLQPDFINGQTGKDFFSFEDNCRIIDALHNMAEKKSVTLLHETHRGTFSFHASSLVNYLDRYPSLQLTADLSHFCVVSESLLEGQEDVLTRILSRVRHLHGRVGHEQGPQVNEPFAPEWQRHLATHTGWWQNIIKNAQASGLNSFTITPEFGPWPYMPSLPYTRQPLSNQWKTNVDMMYYLQHHL